MKVQLIGISGYNYEKNGVRKSGMNMTVRTLHPYERDDGEGNFTYGYITEERFVPRTLKISKERLLELLGHRVELVYERELGRKYETLVAIEDLEEEGGEDDGEAEAAEA